MWQQCQGDPPRSGGDVLILRGWGKMVMWRLVRRQGLVGQPVRRLGVRPALVLRGVEAGATEAAGKVLRGNTGATCGGVNAIATTSGRRR